jgi:hypothetical protein
VRGEAVALRLGFHGEEFGYAIDLGLPATFGKTMPTVYPSN